MGSEGIAPRILNLGITLRLVMSYTPAERGKVTHCIGEWMGSRAGLHAVDPPAGRAAWSLY